MLYEPVCRALGCSWDSVADLPPRVPRLTPAERVFALRDDPAARVLLDRVPRALVAFDEACRRTVAWLGFAGYPVAASARLPV
jgi:hypothetical protein